MNPPVKRFPGLSVLLILLFVVAPPATDPRADHHGVPQALATSPLVIETASGRHRFEVEVAATPEQRRTGLMFRRQMAPDHGMLFDYERPKKVYMWMKNTYIPLDMIFIRKDGTIANIAPSRPPRSIVTTPSDGLVVASLELIGGTTERLGIEAGDLVRHTIFGNFETIP